MKKIKLTNPYNYQRRKESREHPKGKSLTVPNDALSIQQILEKWTHNIDPMLSKQGVFMDDPDLDDLDMNQFEHMDITDKAQVSVEAGNTIKAYSEASKKKQKKADDGQAGDDKKGDS